MVERAIRTLKVEFARRSIVSQRRKDFRAELVLFVDWYQRSGSLARSWARVNCAFIVKLARIVTPRAAQKSSDYFTADVIETGPNRFEFALSSP